jgi:5-dehydro-2-deoxygluconokinase
VTKTLDPISIGRSSIDLYGDRVAGRLDEIGRFSKHIGGSPPTSPAAWRGSG